MATMLQSDPRPQEDRPHWTAVSLTLFILGLLILIPSGLCTAVFGFSTFAADGLDNALLVLLIGGLPIAIGAWLVEAGFRARRRD